MKEDKWEVIYVKPKKPIPKDFDKQKLLREVIKALQKKK
jgi:hypothetical protein